MRSISKFLIGVSCAALITIASTAFASTGEQIISCHAAHVELRKDHWACTATCPKGTHLVAAGLTLAEGVVIGPLSETKEGNGLHCDFASIARCDKGKAPCPITCNAVCAAGA